MTGGTCGTVDPDWLAGHLADDPRFIHVSLARHLPDIAAAGIRPATDHVRGAGALAPRPGCVYLGRYADYGWLAEITRDEVDPDLPLIALALDLTALEPARLLPDEDTFTDVTGPIADPSDYGIPAYDPARWPSQGLWAHEVALGAQPGTVEASLELLGKVAVSGTVPAALLTVHLPGPDGTLTDAGPLTELSGAQLRAIAEHGIL